LKKCAKIAQKPQTKAKSSRRVQIDVINKEADQSGAAVNKIINNGKMKSSITNAQIQTNDDATTVVKWDVSPPIADTQTKPQLTVHGSLTIQIETLYCKTKRIVNYNW